MGGMREIVCVDIHVLNMCAPSDTPRQVPIAMGFTSKAKGVQGPTGFIQMSNLLHVCVRVCVCVCVCVS